MGSNAIPYFMGVLICGLLLIIFLTMDTDQEPSSFEPMLIQDQDQVTENSVPTEKISEVWKENSKIWQNISDGELGYALLKLEMG